MAASRKCCSEGRDRHIWAPSRSSRRILDGTELDDSHNQWNNGEELWKSVHMKKDTLAETPKMNGQWLGRYDGTRRGPIIVNVDERQSYFQGTATILDDDPAAPTSIAFFRTT